MKTYLRLFVSAAFGATVFNALLHYYAGERPLTGFGIFLYVLATILGALTASFIAEPKATIQALKEAVNKLPRITRDSTKETAELVVWAVFMIGIMMTVYCIGYAVMYTWQPLVPKSAIDSADHAEKLLLFPIMGIGYIYLLLFLTITFKITFGLSHERAPGNSASINRHFYKHLGLVVLSATSFGTIIWASWLLWQGVKRIGVPFYALFTLIVLVTIGLTRCERRTAAMAGAAVGMIVGFFWWNPFLVGVTAGTTATALHFATSQLATIVNTQWRSLKIYWRNLPSVKFFQSVMKAIDNGS